MECSLLCATYFLKKSCFTQGFHTKRQNPSAYVGVFFSNKCIEPRYFSHFGSEKINAFFSLSVHLPPPHETFYFFWTSGKLRYVYISMYKTLYVSLIYSLQGPAEPISEVLSAR